MNSLKAGLRPAKVSTGTVVFGASGCDRPCWAVTVGCFPGRDRKCSEVETLQLSVCSSMSPCCGCCVSVTPLGKLDGEVTPLSLQWCWGPPEGRGLHLHHPALRAGFQEDTLHRAVFLWGDAPRRWWFCRLGRGRPHPRWGGRGRGEAGVGPAVGLPRRKRGPAQADSTCQSPAGTFATPHGDQSSQWWLQASSLPSS